LYTRLGELRVMASELGHDPVVAVAGCVAQQEGAAIARRAPGVPDVIIGTQAIRRLPMLVDQALAGSDPRAPRVGSDPGRRGPEAAFLDLNPYDDVTWPL